MHLAFALTKVGVGSWLGVVGVAGVSSWRPSALSTAAMASSRGSLSLGKVKQLCRPPIGAEHPMAVCMGMTQQRPWTGWGLRNFTSLYERRCTFGWVIPQFFADADS